MSRMKTDVYYMPKQQKLHLLKQHLVELFLNLSDEQQEVVLKHAKALL